ncbi:TadE/TadG family type IV pilus assembly protein [Roseicyclus sp.]|jgi:Flp pilus assembly protein TadG|uniref:TadE/TadG family type IV pilus assembly protein n=1 Tax=Roseicyclus sp. TaxID=1914329 RepID=UPI003BAE9DCF|nr:TadE/TadG family type IV pilus assembly protein [Pseudomonadota bacterium]
MPEFIAILRHFIRDERATSTIEFLIMFPVILTLFVAVFETGVILSRQVLMERSLEEAARLLRLSREIVDPVTGQSRPPNADDIKTAICDNTRAIRNCDSVMVVELTVIDRMTYAMPGNGAVCVRRDDPSHVPFSVFDQGAGNQLVMIRACAVIDRILPFSGFGLNLARDDSGGLHMVAASVYVNEPD